MNNLTGHVRAAIDKYDMIEYGETVAVGISGGKDSMFLLHCLKEISRYHPKKFSVAAITADPCFNGEKTDYTQIEDFCRLNDIPYYIERTNLAEIVFSPQEVKNPCSICARMRRGILHNMCVENGIDKLALGHHLDDAVQTFLMNLFYGGKIGSFSPKSYLSRKKITMIRPLIFCEEKQVVKSVNKLSLPVVKSACPVDGKTSRQDTADLIDSLSGRFPDIKAKILGAMQRGGIDGWGIDHLMS